MADHTITSFVATLLYQETMAENFRQIVAEFDEAFRNRPQLPYSFGRPYDDFAVFNIEGAHIVIAHGDTSPSDSAREREDRAVMVLAISAKVAADPSLAPRFQRLLRSIVGRIQRPFPAEAVLWSEYPGMFEPEMFDVVLAEAAASAPYNLPNTLRGEAPEKMASTCAPTDCAVLSGQMGDASAQDTDPEPPPDRPNGRAPRPLHPKPGDRPASSAIRPPNSIASATHAGGNLASPTRASSGQLNAPPYDIANALPDMPAPMLSEAARIRYALYPPERPAQSPRNAPAVHRVSIYTLNTALILVAMPVGVALLTYNVLGRESLTTTARSVALAGIGVALAHTTSFGQALLAFI
ncbi:hypothetical protein [Phaeovulum sp.]|uniref:hypothetical protein n=1 Tax=Phaeovulum sp. TaxID=2934796 RepID=UPI0035614B78